MGALEIAWAKWKTFLILFGNVQLVVVLTIIYWLMLPFLAIPTKLFSDSLAERRGSSAMWTLGEPQTHDMEFMQRQG